MKRFSITLAILFIMVIPSICFAFDRYEYVSESKDAKFYFDTTTIKHVPSSNSINFIEWPQKVLIDNGIIDVWVKFEYTEDGKKDISRRLNKQDDFSYSLYHWVFKTNTPEMKEIFCIDYDTNGRIISQYNTPLYQQTFEAVVPDSVGEDLYYALTNYMIKSYKDLKTWPERLKKIEETQKEVEFLKSEGLLANEFTWIYSDNKRSHFYNPKSLKWVQSTTPKIVDIVLKTTFNQEGLNDLMDRRIKIGITINNNFAFTLNHVQINLTERKMTTISFADYDSNGNQLFKVVVPSDKRRWFEPSSSAVEIDDLIKQLNQ